MKLSILCSIFFIFSSVHFTQDIPDDVNIIIIKTELKPDEAFKQFGKHLINKGYDLKLADKTFLMIVTEPRSIKFGFMGIRELIVSLSAEVLEDPTSIQLKIYFIDPAIQTSLNLENDFDRYKLQGEYSSGSYQEAFEQLNELSSSFEDGTGLEYLIEDESD